MNNNHHKHTITEVSDLETLGSVAFDMSMDPLYVQRLERDIKSGRLIFLAVQINNKYIGGVGVCIGVANEPAFYENWPEYAVIYSLIVDQAYRREGIGTELMSAAESVARREEKKGVVLGVLQGNTAARKMYEKRGYLHQLIDGEATIKSHWRVTGEDRQAKDITVDIMPMILSF